MDEHRIGLKPILRKVWSKRGKRPVAVIRPRYKWLWVVAFVCPESGKTIWWLVPVLNAPTFARLLAGFAEECGAGEDFRILLVLDNAGWHTGREAIVPTGIEMAHCPHTVPNCSLPNTCGRFATRCSSTNASTHSPF
jgi:hypothetical protein